MAQPMRPKVANKKARNAIVMGVVIVTIATCISLALVAKSTSDREAARETEITQKVEDYRGETIKTCTSFAVALNELAMDIYWDGKSMTALTGERIDQYIAKLEAVEVPEEFRELIDKYLVAWVELRDNFVAEKYDETKAALKNIETVAKTANDEINARIDEVITKRITKYEWGLREEEK